MASGTIQNHEKLIVDSWTPTNASAVADRCKYAKFGRTLIIYVNITLTSALNNGSEVQIMKDLESTLGCTVNPSILINSLAYAYAIGIGRVFFNPSNGHLWLSNTSGANFPANTAIYAEFVCTID